MTKIPPAILLFFLHRISTDQSEDLCMMEETSQCYDGVQFPYNAACGRGLDSVRISPDSKYAFFISGWEGYTRLFRIELTGENHSVEPVYTEKNAVGGIGIPENDKILLSKSAPGKPECYSILNLKDGSEDILIQSNLHLIEETAFSEPSEISFDTLDGESRVHGWVLPPQNAEAGKEYPVILYIHGGPHPFYTHGFSHEHQCLAGAGFGVIYCNPRGSKRVWNSAQEP